MGLTYTRYADDLTFCRDGSLNLRIGYLMARVRHIAGDEGFTVNESKSRVLRQSTAQMVTGLVVRTGPAFAGARYAGCAPSCTGPARKAWPPRIARDDLTFPPGCVVKSLMWP